jgi:DMSO/TMAO reductase YedYZ molybdopterin-dependent catalytic subunit
MDDAKREYVARRRSGWSGVAGVAVALGVTELAAALSTQVPSAISAIGSFVIDISPPWLKSFAISAFGTADKAVLAISIVLVALTIGWFVGKASVRNPMPMVIAFGIAGVLGVAAQLGEPGASPALVLSSTLVAIGAGLGTWYAITAWSRPVAPGPDDAADDIGRRRLMVGLAGAATVSIVMVGVGRARLRSRAEAQRAALALPEPVERQEDPTGANDFDLALLTPIVVSNETFYRIDTALVVPTIDPADWTLRIHGMVDREVELSYQDLNEMPLVERYVTLSCVSNEVGGQLVGNALWTGIPLRDLLDMAGVRSGADQLVGRSIDGWTAGFPTELAFDGRDALLALGMNREVLPANHGFPARLVVPGLYGYVSATKWLTEIELTTWDAFDGYWIPRGWSKEGPIKTQSRIDRPKNRRDVPIGPYTVAGVAWAPTREIAAVEVSLDGGPWRVAELSEPLSNDAWVQWRIEADLAEGDHTVTVRATDGTGFTQSESPVDPAPNGAEGWHQVRFRAAPDA